MRSTPGHAAARAEAWRTLRRPLVPEPYQPGGPIIDPASQAWVKIPRPLQASGQKWSMKEVDAEVAIRMNRAV